MSKNIMYQQQSKVGKAKNILLFIIVTFLVSSLSSCLSDIRTSYLKETGISDLNKEKGKNLLKEMATAHGMSSYLSHENLQVVLRDEWPSAMMRMAAMPWHKNKELIQLQYLINTYDSRIDFLEGKAKGDRWGIQHWASYQQKKGEEVQFEKSNKIKFWLPTVQYFI